jgi:hypothetical protein
MQRRSADYSGFICHRIYDIGVTLRRRARIGLQIMAVIPERENSAAGESKRHLGVC